VLVVVGDSRHVAGVFTLLLHATLLSQTAAASDVVHANSAALVLARRNGISSDEGKKHVANVWSKFDTVGANAILSIDKTNELLKSKGVSDLLACGGRSACLSAAFEGTGLEKLVLISVSQVGSERAWVLEVLNMKSAQTMAKEEWIETAGALETACKRLAPLLTAQIETKNPNTVVTDVPKNEGKPDLKSIGVVEKPIEVIAPAQPAAPRMAPKVMLGAGIALAVGSIVLGIASASAFGNANTVDTRFDDGIHSIHTEEQFNKLKSNSLVFGLLSGVAGAGAVGLATASIVTW
jgi:hypothetical protein